MEDVPIAAAQDPSVFSPELSLSADSTRVLTRAGRRYVLRAGITTVK